MRTVFKYQFEINDNIEIYAPPFFEILKVDTQNDVPTLWALVDPHEAPTIQHFHLRGTGHPVSSLSIHVGSFFQGPFVWHLFR